MCALEALLYIHKKHKTYISKYILPYAVGGIIPLTRKTRFSGKSIVLTIPSQLVKAYDINDGDDIEIIPLRNGELKIRKARYIGSSGGA